MKRLLPLLLLVASLTPIAAQAELPWQIALQTTPGCGHVIDLLNRYGGPPISGRLVIRSPGGGFMMPLDELGDLGIASVEEVPGAGPAPTILVGITNNSTRKVCDVRVSVVALLGAIRPGNPTVSGTIAEIPAGATVEVELTLPRDALAMGNNGGTPVGFHKLLVAIDSLDHFAETDESNNLKLVCRADLPKRIAAPVTEPALPTEVSPVPPPAAEQPAIEKALEKFGLDLPQAGAAAQKL